MKQRSKAGTTVIKGQPRSSKGLRSENLSRDDTIAGLVRERDEASDQLFAASEVLKIINSSQGELEAVFRAILENATRICEAKFGSLFRINGEMIQFAAAVHTPPALAEFYSRPGPFQMTSGSMLDRVIQSKRVIHTADYASEAIPGSAAKFGGARSTVCVPMVKNEALVGAMFVYRQEVRPFSDKQIVLLQNFADQAVIAIENARLIKETREALERQTATADILKVIASSPDDVQPVFDAIAESARRVIGGFSTVVTRVIGEAIHLAAFTTGSDAGSKALTGIYPQPISSSLAAAQVVRTGHIFMQADTENDAGVTKELARARGFRSLLSVPMLRHSNVIGTINVTRAEPGGFDENEVSLMRTFADQAVIAIENARLFNETKDALARQIATADVLKVIASSPSDLQPVFDAIAARSKDLVGGHSAAVIRYIDTIAELAAYTPVSLEADSALRALYPMPIASNPQFEQVHGGEISEITDFESEDVNPDFRHMARARGFRSRLFVPLKADAGVIGLISVTRKEAGKFIDKDVDLLKTFADQAVIAIKNVELFDEVQARTRELSQSLDNLRAAQDRLVQTEKLASLGQLTAGIAHEIKNPLNFVNNFSVLSVDLADELNHVLGKAKLAETFQKEVEELTSLLKSNLEKVVQHGKRADSIVKNMLLHSREGSGERRLADINALVSESLNLAYHGARAEKPGFSITLNKDFDPGAGAVEVYPQEITRALLNLISNGFYAATLRKAENGDETFEPALSASTRNRGETVEIRIRDNGTGIPPDVKEKMFNPFFTTKPTGEGTGLGLSMTHDIVVKQHGGRIDVETEPGSFTEFVVTLPRGNG